MKLQTTEHYFKMDSNQLLEIKNNGYTKEECLILDEGLKVVFLDDLEEYEEEKNGIKEWQPNLEIKVILKTINERIAVVLH
jgi:hypothetical protein